MLSNFHSVSLHVAVGRCTSNTCVVSSCVRLQKDTQRMKQQPPHSLSNGKFHLAVKVGAHAGQEQYVTCLHERQT